MNHTRVALIDEYWQLLRDRGVDHLVRLDPQVEKHAKVLDQIWKPTRQETAESDEANLPAILPHGQREKPATLSRDPYARTSKRIEDAVYALNFSIPRPVYVGEYPHQSFNAQAYAAKNGTLLLINVGLLRLLFEVTLALGNRVLVGDHAKNGGIWIAQETPAERCRTDNADEILANSLATYILHADPGRGGEQEVDSTINGRASYLLADAAATFAVAHEYGHVLADHFNGQARHSARGGWLSKSRSREFEADEIGIQLSLKAQDVDKRLATLSIRKHIAVEGAFLFFAIDHLLNRVREQVSEVAKDRIVSDHPPSDARAAALRHMLIALEGPNILQSADIAVTMLAKHEQPVISNLRRLIPEQADLVGRSRIEW